MKTVKGGNSNPFAEGTLMGRGGRRKGKPLIDLLFEKKKRCSGFLAERGSGI